MLCPTQFGVEVHQELYPEGLHKMGEAQDPCEGPGSPSPSCNRHWGCSSVVVGKPGSRKPMLIWGRKAYGLPSSLCHNDLEVELVLASDSECRGGRSSPMGRIWTTRCFAH